MAPVFGYWNIRGLATPIRLLLTHAGVEFEDKLYGCGGPPDFDRSQWLKEKFTLGLDFPNLPYYIDDDVKLSQSNVIIAYLGRKHGLAGKTEVDQARVELITSQIYDYRMECARVWYSPDFEKLKDDLAKSLPDKMKTLSTFLGDRKYVVGDYLTYADFLLFELLEVLLFTDSNLLKDFPSLEAYHKRISDLEGVKKYFNSSHAIKFPFNGAPARFGGEFSEQLAKGN